MRKEILKYMEKHGQVDLQELAILLGTDEVTVANEIAEEFVTALIEVRLTPQRNRGFDRIAERICQYPEVRSAYLISGAYDVMIILESKTLKEVSLFVSEKLAPIDEVVGTATHFILKKYKDHGKMMAAKPESERMPVTF